MDFEDICFWPFVLLTIFVIVQVIRFVFADADFGLLWAARFGKKAGETNTLKYSQTSLIHASLIRMPHNLNTLLGNLFYHFIFTMIQ